MLEIQPIPQAVLGYYEMAAFFFFQTTYFDAVSSLPAPPRVSLPLSPPTCLSLNKNIIKNENQNNFKKPIRQKY